MRSKLDDITKHLFTFSSETQLGALNMNKLGVCVMFGWVGVFLKACDSRLVLVIVVARCVVHVVRFVLLPLLDLPQHNGEYDGQRNQNGAQQE